MVRWIEQARLCVLESRFPLNDGGGSPLGTLVSARQRHGAKSPPSLLPSFLC